MHITPRLSVEGPDGNGSYELQVHGDGYATIYLTRAEADALIAALQPAAPASPADTMRAHLDTFGAKDGGA